MDLQLIDLPAEYLNPDALASWKEPFLGMDAWMRAVLIGLFALLAGSCLLAWLWGFRMKRFARFITGFSLTFFPVFLLLLGEYAFEPLQALLYALGAGAAGGVLNAFLVRIFRLLEGTVLGAVVFSWALPTFLEKDVTEDDGRIWLLVLSLILGVLFALLAKKLAFLETAAVAGCVLGLLIVLLVPFDQIPLDKIPFLSEKLNISEEQYRMYLPGVMAGVGALIQLLQWLGVRRKEKALAIPVGDETSEEESRNHWEDGEDPADQAEGDDAPLEEDISFAQAEEILVEKAHELVQAAERSAETERLKERCRDVAEGLYSSEVAAEKLGLTQEQFEEQMKRFGFAGEKQTDQPEEPQKGPEDPQKESEKQPEDPQKQAEEQPADQTENTKTEQKAQDSASEQKTQDSASEQKTQDSESEQKVQDSEAKEDRKDSEKAAD